MLWPLHSHTGKEIFSAVGLIKDMYKDVTQMHLLKRNLIYHVYAHLILPTFEEMTGCQLLE
jgi:hypothetical protein